MFRSLLLTIAAALLLAPAGPAQNTAKKSAFDKATMEAYVRHLWVLGPDFKIAVSDPKPSTLLPGFKDVTVRVSQGAMSQDIALMISNDGAKIVQGNVFDVNFNPFKPDLDRLKTQFQPSFGTPGAPVILVEFSDMECPHCKVEAEMIRKNLLQAYPTQVRFYFKEFPLESLHPWAKPAAIAGRCVFRQNAPEFWEYHDWVFAHQEGITPDTLKSQVMDWAKGRKDLDVLQLSKCIDDKATENEVDTNIAEARTLGVDGTPALFINGRRVPAGTEWNNVRRIIDYEIDYQKTAKNAGENCGCETTLDAPGLPAKPAITPIRKK
ncbi:MAG: DsbA family protein [Acidobacteriia bacterium]|nr:DsbA family protein [Terriglobia bacterium]